MTDKRTDKEFENVFSRFDTIPACDRQTDRQTDDRQTDGQISCDGIVRAMHVIAL